MFGYTREEALIEPGLASTRLADNFRIPTHCRNLYAFILCSARLTQLKSAQQCGHHAAQCSRSHPQPRPGLAKTGSKQPSTQWGRAWISGGRAAHQGWLWNSGADRQHEPGEHGQGCIRFIARQVVEKKTQHRCCPMPCNRFHSRLRTTGGTSLAHLI